MEAILEVGGARSTCPYHLRRRARRIVLTSSTPRRSCSTVEGVVSLGFTAQIHGTIALSFRRSLCRSWALGAQDSLPCNSADRTAEENTLPLVLREICREVRTGSSFLNLLHATQHLVVTASSQPPPADNVSPR